MFLSIGQAWNSFCWRKEVNNRKDFPPCLHLQHANHIRIEAFHALPFCVLQLRTFIKAETGAVVSKVNENVQYLKAHWGCNAGTGFLSSTKQQASKTCRESFHLHEHSWRKKRVCSFDSLHCPTAAPVDNHTLNTCFNRFLLLFLPFQPRPHGSEVHTSMVIISCQWHLMNYSSPLHSFQGWPAVQQCFTLHVCLPL